MWSRKLLVKLLGVGIVVALFWSFISGREKSMKPETVIIDRDSAVDSIFYEKEDLGVDSSLVEESETTLIEYPDVAGDLPSPVVTSLNSDSYQTAIGLAVTNNLEDEEFRSLFSESFLSNYSSFLLEFPYVELSGVDTFDRDFEGDWSSKTVTVFVNSLEYQFSFVVDSDDLVESISYIGG